MHASCIFFLTRLIFANGMVTLCLCRLCLCVCVRALRVCVVVCMCVGLSVYAGAGACVYAMSQYNSEESLNKLFKDYPVPDHDNPRGGPSHGGA